MKGFVVAGTGSGVGKTVITAGIIGALRARGLRVAPFKAGPDYIDPSYHTLAAGQPCRNLDSWMLPEAALRASFGRAVARADVAVVEGVMGLFDGHAGDSNLGSTAHLAKMLGLPVVLVVDAGGMARSAAAMVLGYRQFDPELRICGVILNRLGSERHMEFIQPALQEIGVPLLGGFLRDDELVLPERHLGLVPTAERLPLDVLKGAARQAETRVDLDVLVAASPEVAAGAAPAGAGRAAGRVPVAVAMDEAFSFYYQDSLDMLAAAGADLLEFSPLRDLELPAGAAGVILGGGFPEMYAADLAANTSMHAAIAGANARGLPIYAECGGHMYLGRSLTDASGSAHRMVGLTGVESTLVGTRLTLGYRTIRARADGPILARGETVRAHEFHLSASPAADEATACYDVMEPALGVEGVAAGNLWSSYIHVHFGAAPGAPARFVERCAAAI